MMPLLYDFQEIGEECYVEVVDDTQSFTISLEEVPAPPVAIPKTWLGLGALAALIVGLGAWVATRPKAKKG